MKIRPTVTDVRSKLEQLHAHLTEKPDVYAERVWELEHQLTELIEEYVTAHLRAASHKKSD